ncbi:hypothetical protein BDZ90DRAFT_226023 [Jaminaea rosea]|uniref:Uncharacterized protein n=1 Tax=Jaminaea rosea TaxID=1569628 RepID=A0A316UWX5_9BASI|nr:hypothetical protein BDZ90DRAFT_226023 [Jaminaea rosea]PWN29789.1 hypothetical protein BDZ90DRAFT_226023 [Jaminaea rosea]
MAPTSPKHVVASRQSVGDNWPSWIIKGPIYDKPGSDPISQQIQADQEAQAQQNQQSQQGETAPPTAQHQQVRCRAKGNKVKPSADETKASMAGHNAAPSHATGKSHVAVVKEDHYQAVAMEQEPGQAQGQDQSQTPPAPERSRPFGLDDLDIPSNVPVGPIYNEAGDDVTGQAPSLQSIKDTILNWLHNQRRSTGQHHEQQHHFVDASMAKAKASLRSDSHHGQHLHRRNAPPADLQLDHPGQRRPPMSLDYPATSPKELPHEDLRQPQPHSRAEHPAEDQSEGHPEEHPDEHHPSSDKDQSAVNTDSPSESPKEEPHADLRHPEAHSELDADAHKQPHPPHPDDDHHRDHRSDDESFASSDYQERSRDLSDLLDDVNDEIRHLGHDIKPRADSGSQTQADFIKSLEKIQHQLDDLEQKLHKQQHKGKDSKDKSPLGTFDDDEDEDRDDRQDEEEEGHHHHHHRDRDIENLRKRLPHAFLTKVKRQQTIQIPPIPPIPSMPPIPSIPPIPGSSPVSSPGASPAQQTQDGGNQRGRNQQHAGQGQHPDAKRVAAIPAEDIHESSPESVKTNNARDESIEAPTAPAVPPVPPYSKPAVPAVPAIPSQQQQTRREVLDKRQQAPAAPTVPTAPQAPALPNASAAPAAPAAPTSPERPSNGSLARREISPSSPSSAGKKRLYGIHRKQKAEAEAKIRCSHGAAAQSHHGKRLFGEHHREEAEAKSKCPPSGEEKDDDKDDDEDADDDRDGEDRHHHHARDSKAAMSPDIERLHQAYRAPPLVRRQDHTHLVEDATISTSASLSATASAAAASNYNATLGTNLSCLESLGLMVVIFAVLMSIVTWLGAKRAYHARRRMQRRHQATVVEHAKVFSNGIDIDVHSHGPSGDDTLVNSSPVDRADQIGKGKKELDQHAAQHLDRSDADSRAPEDGERQSLLLSRRDEEGIFVLEPTQPRH